MYENYPLNYVFFTLQNGIFFYPTVMIISVNVLTFNGTQTHKYSDTVT